MGVWEGLCPGIRARRTAACCSEANNGAGISFSELVHAGVKRSQGNFGLNVVVPVLLSFEGDEMAD